MQLYIQKDTYADKCIIFMCISHYFIQCVDNAIASGLAPLRSERATYWKFFVSNINVHHAL